MYRDYILYSGDCIGEGSGHEREVSGVAWLSHDNNMLVSTSHDQHAHIWKFDRDMHELNCVAICKGHSRIIEALDVNENNEKVRMLFQMLLAGSLLSVLLYFCYSSVQEVLTKF